MLESKVKQLSNTVQADRFGLTLPWHSFFHCNITKPTPWFWFSRDKMYCHMQDGEVTLTPQMSF